MTVWTLARGFDNRATPLPSHLRGLLKHGLVGFVETVVVAAELLLGYAWLTESISPLQLFAAHVGILCLYVASLRTLNGGISGTVVFRAVMLFMLGPLVFVRFLIPVNAAAAREAAPASSRSKDAIAADTLYAEILADRRPRRDPTNRRTLRDAIDSGELAEQQFAIAVISQRYEPEMFAALAAALQSPTPAVRVQAAAVFAKLRERSTAEAKQILEEWRSDGVSTEERGARAARCRRLADSGFLEDETVAKLQRLADELVPDRKGASPKSVTSEARPSQSAGAASGGLPRMRRPAAAGRSDPAPGPKYSARAGCHAS